jgi:hypothetical protein
MLEKYNLTTDMLVEYYKDHLKSSIYKSLMRKYLVELNFETTLIDSILLQGKTELIKPDRKKKTTKGFEGTEEQHELFKKKDGKVRRTINDFERIVFP